METLTELRLCTRDEVAGCESQVRKLCHDLPDFDSVWLDVLVQKRILTPWQADILQSDDAESLRTEEFLRRDVLGRNTFLAVSTVTQRWVVLQQLATPAETQNERLATRLFNLLEQLDEVRETAPAGIELPRRVLDVGCEHRAIEATNTESRRSSPKVHHSFALASAYVSGWTAEDLIIRGGRIPWMAVAEIGRQMLHALEWMEQHGFVHGDVVLRNVRLSPDGSTVLVAPFVSRILRPLQSFSANMKLRDVETTAPELVGTGAQPDSRSELYAVGCVLWQLLTARPVFLAADPVNKVVKSQEKDVPDVRTLVPDCPDWMARLIHSFTRRTPELRPETIHGAAEKWDRYVRSGTRCTVRLLRRLPDRSARLKPAPVHSRTLLHRLAPVMAAAFMVVAFTAYGAYRGLLPQTLTLNRSPKPAVSSVRSDTATADAATADAAPTHADVTESGLRRMPRPDAAGVVVLQSGEAYEASDLSFAGVMHVETTDDASAVVVLQRSEPWHLKATQIILRNVQTEFRSPADTTAEGPAVICECDVLSVSHCLLQCADESHTNSCLKWTPKSAVTSVVSVADCVIAGNGYGLWLDELPTRCELDNLLLAASGVAVRCDVSAGGDVSGTFQVHRVTQSAGRGFLDVVMEADRPGDLRLEILCGESVLAPTSNLVRVAGPPDWPRSSIRMEFLLPERGNPTIVPPDVHPAAFFDRSLNSLVALDPSQLKMESLLIAQPLFRDNTSTAATADSFTAFQLIDYEGPKLSPMLPGVDTSRLPLRVAVSGDETTGTGDT